MHHLQYYYHTPELSHVLGIFKKSVYFLITETNSLQKKNYHSVFQSENSLAAKALMTWFSEDLNNHLFLLLLR